MTTPQARASLLSLPRELRDEIYLYTLTQTWDPNRNLRVNPSPSDDGQLYYWPEHNKWQPTAFLTACHQTRSEILEVIHHQHKTSIPRLELDLRAKGFVSTPTWTLLNFGLLPRSSVDLHVNLTILSTEAFRRNDSWPRSPGQIFRTLLNFLNRFIFHGPSFLDHAPPCRTVGPHFIATLSLRVTFEDWYTRATHADTVHEVFRMCKALSLLDVAGKYIGKVKVSTKYEYREGEVERGAEWEVKAADEAPLREADWAALGFRFGESWRDEVHVG